MLCRGNHPDYQDYTSLSRGHRRGRGEWGMRNLFQDLAGAGSYELSSLPFRERRKKILWLSFDVSPINALSGGQDCPQDHWSVGNELTSVNQHSPNKYLWLLLQLLKIYAYFRSDNSCKSGILSLLCLVPVPCWPSWVGPAINAQSSSGDSVWRVRWCSHSWQQIIFGSEEMA